MDDLISRQQAIDAVVGCTNCGTEDVLRAYVTKHSLENGWTGGIVDALDAIEQVPSVQPDPCGDVVSRNAIIQKLNKMDRYVSTELRLCDTDKIFPQNEVFIVDDVYEEIVEQLPSVQPEQRWIPVSERLPEPRVDVWVNSDIGQIQGYYEEHVGVWYASFGQGRDYLELIVNAWMPLPEPYKEEQE